MSTQHAELWAALAAPFEPHQVRTRPGGRGTQLSYITARTAMNRLDDVLGPENWEDTYTETKDGLMCSITVTMPDGRKVTKTDGGGYADMPEEDNTEKSGYSDAFKRACVKFGIARYLYQDGVPAFIYAIHSEQGLTGESRATRQAPPKTEPPRNGNGHNNGNSGGGGRTPTNGKGLYAWAKEQGDRSGADVVGWLNKWGERENLPAKMVEWDAETVGVAVTWVLGRLQKAGASN